jgi:hypothetical protein
LFIKLKDMIQKILFTAFIIGILVSCKKSADVAPALIPERLEISPVSNSILIGATSQFTLKFYNNTGQEAAVPATVSWNSTNPAIATVNTQGLVTAMAAGQVEIKAFYNSIVASALLTVVINSSQLATVNITNVSSGVQEILLNQPTTLTAEGRNVAGQVIPGLSFTWTTSNSSFVEVNNAGLVTGKAYGTSNVAAASGGIQSAPVMLQVIRMGDFVNMGSQGKAKLKIENNVLKLQTTSNFSVSSAPDLRIYLSNSTTSIANALEIATLTQRSGAQSWNIAAPTTITQYRYVMVWCKQFGGNYGHADLGN